MLYSCPAGRKVGTFMSKEDPKETEIDDRAAAVVLEKALEQIPNVEGELKLGVTHKNKKVVIIFGRPIDGLSVPSSVARSLAQAILEHADKVDREALIEEGEADLEKKE